MSDLRQAQRQRDIARSHRDEALRQFDDAMKLVEKTRKELIEATREKNTAIKERDTALYLKKGAERRLEQSLHDVQWAVNARQKSVMEREEMVLLINKLEHKRNRGWDNVARLREELNQIRNNQAGSSNHELVVRHSALSYPIVTQKKAAKKAQERNMKLRKQKLV